MFAKQTAVSASLWLLLAGSLAAADDAAPVTPSQDTDEAHPRTGTFELGAGFATDDGFVAHARIAQPNLFGTGRLLSLDATISQREQRFALDYAEPHLLGSDVTLGTRLVDDRRVLPGFTRVSAGGSLSLSRTLGDHVTGFIGSRLEQVSTEPYVLARGGALPAGGLISAVGAGLEYSNVDSKMNPMRGTAIGTSIDVADRRWGSELEFVRTRSWFHTHQAIGALTLHLSGSIDTVTNPGGVAASERLYFDGSSGVRGYAPGAIGPLGGGNLQLLGRAELEAPLVRSAGLSLTGFYDAGMLRDDRGNGGFGASTGFGLAWHSPLGVVHADWAFPLDGGKPHFIFSL